MTGRALAEAASALVGTRFLLHGRDPSIGLDCVGVLAAALEAIGRSSTLPDDYTLRAAPRRDLNGIAARCGFEAGDPPFVAGDVPLVRIGACQTHLLIALDAGDFVHAHAGLRRVVRHNGALRWPVAALWRLPDPN